MLQDYLGMAFAHGGHLDSIDVEVYVRHGNGQTASYATAVADQLGAKNILLSEDASLEVHPWQDAPASRSTRRTVLGDGTAYRQWPQWKLVRQPTIPSVSLTWITWRRAYGRHETALRKERLYGFLGFQYGDHSQPQLGAGIQTR